jgi:hypothetical protein
LAYLFGFLCVFAPSRDTLPSPPNHAVTILHPPPIFNKNFPPLKTSFLTHHVIPDIALPFVVYKPLFRY